MPSIHLQTEIPLFQQQADGGDQIGATADRLGEQNIGSLLLAEGFGCLKQRVAPAAETAAGDLFDGEVGGPAERGVDQADKRFIKVSDANLIVTLAAADADVILAVIQRVPV